MAASLVIHHADSAFIAPGKNKEWPKNAIDQFVLERLEREGMEPRRKRTARR